VYSADPPPAPTVCTVCGGRVVQRPDDVAEVIAERLSEYEHETAPLLEHYEARGLLSRVDGTGTLDEVFEKLCAVIDALHA
jgi:adenylate kinase